MKILDLGRLDTPLVLFGGPYSNLHASEALLNFAKSSGFGPKQLICTGDLVAYCAQAAETVALFREFGCAILAGNCEQQLAANALDCGCGFEDGTACDLLAAGWYAHANKTVSDADRAWMGGLPELIRFEHHGKTYVVVHGGATAINRFIWSVSSPEEFIEEFQFLESQIGAFDVVISGHSGIAFQREIAGKVWINAGAIGLPANDGTATTEFVVLAEGDVQFHRLDYDADAARNKMIEVGLTQGYHDTLLSGFWPSEDVLPDVLRRGV